MNLKNIQDIDGWLTDDECYCLYNLSKISTGPILEIGCWVGKSTTCICEGIVDSHPKTFDTVDVFPTLDNFIENDDLVYFSVNGVKTSSMNIKDPSYNTIKQLIGKGIYKELVNNLKNNNVYDLVNIIHNDFHNISKINYYNFIFADVTHDIYELELNFEKIISLGSNTCIYAFHDITDEIERWLISHKVTKINKIDNLFIFKNE